MPDQIGIVVKLDLKYLCNVVEILFFFGQEHLQISKNKRRRKKLNLTGINLKEKNSEKNEGIKMKSCVAFIYLLFIAVI